ncbi:EAL domain-containing protein [Sulfurimonas sp. HSL-1716]|uniref:putative bifunctional diguanylate cyclase/phosphodiesterase n=1 Tax=Hydrocurvibacter sulfurireducens TaxID=3131937 RepID=UPI0031F8ADD2
MKLSIKEFNLILYAIIIVVFTSLSVFMYVSQREKMVDLIAGDIQKNLLEVGYYASKVLDSTKNISVLEPMIDRRVASNEIVDDFLVLKNQTPILSSKVGDVKLPKKDRISSDLKHISFYDLLNKKGFQTDIYIYEQDKPIKLNLLLILNHDLIKQNFLDLKTNFLIIYGLIFVFIYLFLWKVIDKYVIFPLEKLRQYAYYNSAIPPMFMIKELEYIRSSMLQTFTRLEIEKEKLYMSSITDELSGLSNRNHLEERLTRLIAKSDRDKKEFAFVFMDIDHFKDVNDLLGHTIGDNLLVDVSKKLPATVKINDIVARIGGDEFVLVISEYKSLMDLTNILQNVLDIISSEWTVNNHKVNISASMGVAFYPKDGMDIESLLKNSDIALFEAKNKGRARFNFFTQELNKKIINEIETNNRMREALKNEEFELYYQPKVDIATSKIIGAEALIRWNSPKNGLISPNEFIPIAENSGFIVELGEWIFKTAFEQQKRWSMSDMFKEMLLSVNVSAKQIANEKFMQRFKTIYENSGADSNNLEIELTESVFINSVKEAFEIVNLFHSLGFTISLDDFGTGYSSLSYLKKFSFDVIKIDKSFIDDYSSKSGKVYIDTIIKMGHSLGIKLIAEGVETKEQLEFLKEVECNVYQGYYCSRPLPIREFEELVLKTNN